MTYTRHKKRNNPDPRKLPPPPEAPARSRVPAVLLGVDEAAAALSIGRGTLYQLMRAGDIRPVKIGSRTLLSVAELRRFAEQLTARGGEA